MRLTLVRDLDDELAASIGGRTLSYGELRAAAGAVAEQLAGLRRVVIWAENTLETVVGVTAALESGVELVPLNPMLGSGELEHALSDSQPEAMIAAADQPPLCERRIAIDLDAQGELPPMPPGAESDVALIVCTSGTTGPPKGAMLSRRAVASNLDALAEAWDWTSRDRLVHALPLFHIHGLVLGLLGPLRRGGSVRHLGRFSPEGVATALRAGDTMLFAVPTMYHRLAAAARRDPELAAALSRARLLVSGSSALPASTFEEIERLTEQRIAERYGLTETLINAAVRADGQRRAGEVGRPLGGVELRLVTEEGEDAPSDGETLGEIAVRGPNLFSGYLNRPRETSQSLRDGWFWTGDIATRAPDGYLRIVGRSSTDLIKTGGYKVGAGEVEATLLEHPAVSEAAVAGVADEDLGERIVAWVVLEPDVDAPAAEDLSGHVVSWLAPHKRPRQVLFVSELPRNAMGKVVKQRLTADPNMLG
ncbi:MAG: AMP-binding protein [Solirubrobacteraceae bacterium]